MLSKGSIGASLGASPSRRLDSTLPEPPARSEAPVEPPMIVADEPPQVLLVLREDDCASSCLQRTYDLTCALRAELQVLRVLPAPPRLLRVFRQEPAKVRAEARGCLRATRSWLANAFGEEPPVGRVLVRRGNFVDAVVRHTQSANVELIIVPRFRRAGVLATELARRSAVKVLVAHEPAKRRSILAATDLASDGFPVLQQAARLGLALQAPLTALHNVDPLMVADRAAARLPRGAVTALAGAQRQVRLADAVRSLPVATTPIVRVEIDPVFAILEEARRQDFDIVVVGVHERSRLDLLLHGSVAARVVHKTRCSVLVTPIS
jgi:universal stress protein A